MQSNDEYLDFVNTDDQPVDSKLRSEIYSQGLSNFRVVNAFLVNSAGRIWIPKRSATKKYFLHVLI